MPAQGDNKKEGVKKDHLTLSNFIKTIPELPRGLAIMILLCNIFFPSSGTFYMACIGDKVRKTQFLVAAFQLISIPILIGYIWSIFWGIKAVQKSY